MPKTTSIAPAELAAYNHGYVFRYFHGKKEGTDYHAKWFYGTNPNLAEAFKNGVALAEDEIKNPKKFRVYVAQSQSPLIFRAACPAIARMKAEAANFTVTDIALENDDEAPAPAMDVELALKLAGVVHEKCANGVPHDIGITLAEIVATHK